MDKPSCQSDPNGLRAPSSAEFLKDSAEVHFCGALRNPEHAADFLVRLASHHTGQYFPLPLRQFLTSHRPCEAGSQFRRDA